MDQWLEDRQTEITQAEQQQQNKTGIKKGQFESSEST